MFDFLVGQNHDTSSARVTFASPKMILGFSLGNELNLAMDRIKSKFHFPGVPLDFQTYCILEYVDKSSAKYIYYSDTSKYKRVLFSSSWKRNLCSSTKTSRLKVLR